jgi:hypothetical protein
MDKEFNNEWQALLKSIGARPMLWGITGGNEWIAYKQMSENEYSVQIFTNDGFETYKKQKDAIIRFFEGKNIVLSKEIDVKKMAFGYWKQIDFISQSEADKRKEDRDSRSSMTPVQITTQINGDVHTEGGSLNTGNAETIDNSSLHIVDDDKKWFHKEIVKIILSFIGGVAATIAAQWLMRIIGWIS